MGVKSEKKVAAISALKPRGSSKHTLPEIRVRQALHAAGIGFRLHDKTLPGTPDISLSKHKLAIFVHGCFWHQHPGCGVRPKTNLDFWVPKLRRNAERDAMAVAELRAIGWRSLVVWECATRKFFATGELSLMLCEAIGSKHSSHEIAAS